MKKYLKEIIILIIQLLIFYVFPLSIYLFEPIGMVLLMLIFTLIVSIILGVISNKKIKYLFPIIIAILFLPTIFMYYNESALVHSIWYLVDSYIGLFIGFIISKLTKINL